MTDADVAALRVPAGSRTLPADDRIHIASDAPRRLLCGLLREYGAWLVTLVISVLAVAMSMLAGLLVVPAFLGPVTAGTVMVTIVIPAIVSPPIIYLTMRLLHELDSAERRLQQISVTDELTRVFNRRHLLSAMRVAISRSLRYGEEMSILMMDIDRFKSVNDRYGHPMGDQVLVATARCIGAHLRNIDVLARFGGEEFVAILPNTTEEGALVLAERVRKAVAELRFVTPRGELATTISIGTTSLRASDESVEILLARADEALYEAKAQGRDRVVAA